ncbi:helix-turn-helix domain-containing protein [Paraburkholderia sp. CNPSo 3157]|uniref:Helix-turn-helix domain-containing protein n=1 Tax=Paraburkholderia franconis TaxID=2654983 RepID=A0A7X1NCP4_9BURK|nr:IclR family transcriptional regulator [Paraburkholderia franconis]MPW19554.1 helix-turn-helix domain-containing protein [Paraburkholderia franconis]
MRNDTALPPNDPPHDNTRVLRPLAVLEQLASAGQPFSLSQLSARLHIPKATLMRLIESLETQGYVTHMPDSRGAERAIALGPRAAHLALATLANNTFTRACRSLLRSLVDALGETCNLTALDGDTVLYIERVETAEPLRLHMQPGTRVPLHCTASGKLFLSQMPLAERRPAVSRLTLKRMTYRTLTDRSLLEAELDRLGARGIGIDNEEFVRGMVAIAVPVRDAANGNVLAALAVHAPTARANLNDLLEAVPKMKETALAIAPLLQFAETLSYKGVGEPSDRHATSL